MKYLLGIGVFILVSFQVKALAPLPPLYESVLFVGDSHSYGKFGDEVDKYLRSVSVEVTSMASCGSSPSTWMSEAANFKSTNCGYWSRNAKGQEVRVKDHKVNSFTDELSKTDPDLTVIALGTNILVSPADIQREKAAIEKMLDQVEKAKSKCIWVGPPDLAKNPYKANLAAGVKELKALTDKYKCTYIDSTKLTKYPASNKDGIHYGPRDSALWGVAVAKEIEKASRPTLKEEQQLNQTPPPASSVDHGPR